MPQRQKKIVRALFVAIWVVAAPMLVLAIATLGCDPPPSWMKWLLCTLFGTFWALLISHDHYLKQV